MYICKTTMRLLSACSQDAMRAANLSQRLCCVHMSAFRPPFLSPEYVT